MEECAVCYNTFNKTLRRRVDCPYCPKKICVACHRKYLLETTEAAHCMDCRTAWPLDVCYAVLPHVFWKEYEVRRAQLGVAQEKNLLPETMLDIQRKQLRRDLKNVSSTMVHVCNRLNTRSGNLVPEPNQPGVLTYDLLEFLAEHTKTYVDTKKEYDALCAPAGFVDAQTSEDAPPVDVDAPLEPEIYLPCPAEGCTGFTNRRGTCGLCNAKVCLRCRMPKGDEHACVQADVDTVELMKKDCKACPKCRAMIYRIEGCPQMFCTVCHCQFHWHTGELLKSIHNPHLTEWMLSHGTQGNAICDVTLAYSAFPAHTHARVGSYYDRAMHIARYVIPELTRTVEPVHASLRRRFLLKEITEVQWANEIRLYNRREERTRAIIQILEMFHGVVLQSLDEVNRGTTTWGAVEPLLAEVTESMNTKLDELHTRYKIVVYKYKWTPNNYLA